MKLIEFCNLFVDKNACVYLYNKKLSIDENAELETKYEKIWMGMSYQITGTLGERDCPFSNFPVVGIMGNIDGLAGDGLVVSIVVTEQGEAFDYAAITIKPRQWRILNNEKPIETTYNRVIDTSLKIIYKCPKDANENRETYYFYFNYRDDCFNLRSREINLLDWEIVVSHCGDCKIHI